MTYTDDDEYAQFRGYDDFADLVDSETIPSSTGLTEIRKRANATVNVAFDGTEDDSDEYTTLLGQYEMVVMNRMINSAHKMDQAEDPMVVFLTEEERKMLRGLSSGGDVDTISMSNTDNPFTNKRGGIW